MLYNKIHRVLVLDLDNKIVVRMCAYEIRIKNKFNENFNESNSNRKDEKFLKAYLKRILGLFVGFSGYISFS